MCLCVYTYSVFKKNTKKQILIWIIRIISDKPNFTLSDLRVGGLSNSCNLDTIAIKGVVGGMVFHGTWMTFSHMPNVYKSSGICIFFHSSCISGTVLDTVYFMKGTRFGYRLVEIL